MCRRCTRSSLLTVDSVLVLARVASGLARKVREMLSAEAQAADKLRVSGFDQKAEVYETVQKEYRRLRREHRNNA